MTLKQFTIGTSSIHLLALAISTYIAAIEIETILVTGWICSVTGVVTGISAIMYRRPLIAVAGFMTPIIAASLFVLEVYFLQLGPSDAALPFSIVFIVNQVLATLAILVQLNIIVARADSRPLQTTVRSLLVSMVSFSVFFSIARYLLEREHNWLMGLALALLGLTFVGLSIALYTGLMNRNKVEITA